MSEGCGKYVGEAFDNPFMKVYCGDEVFGGETAGLIIKLCDKCKKKFVSSEKVE